MKSYRINFDKGINVIGDKALLPDGFASILDNVDLRSGFPRPFKKPEYQFAVDSSTTCSWSYRGQWFHSSNHREYVGDYIGGIQRVYQFEDGKLPKKIIGDKAATLGAPKPKNMLGVAGTALLVPGGFSGTVLYKGYGNLSNGKRVYRIAVRTADGILPPSGPVSLNVNDTQGQGASVELNWGIVQGVLGYVIFEGDDTNQYKLTEVAPSITTFSDTGSITPSGDTAKQYFQDQQFAYAYTYIRNVGGVIDESGISYPSLYTSSFQGRIVTRDYLNDGYFDQVDPVTDQKLVKEVTSGISVTSRPSPVSLVSWTASYNDVINQTSFSNTSHILHGLVTGDTVKFVMTDPEWNGKVFEAVYVDDYTFAVQGASLPKDASASTPFTGCTFTLQRSTISYTSSGVIHDGDAVQLTMGANVVLCKATYNSATSVTLNTYIPDGVSPQIKWVPNNGYCTKWALYRNEQGGWFKVDEIDVSKSTYNDAKPFSALGGPPSSYYEDQGLLVDYAQAPMGMRSPVLHYGMLFGIDGYKVRWTPILQPDAWPDVHTVTLPYQPVKLESFAQGLIILCQDAIYRLDGNSPGGMSLSKTQAEDGCFAPHTVQKTDRGLIYLSKRGVMLFNGTHADCLTDTRVKPESIAGPSRITPAYPFWWMPTLLTRNYADLAGEDIIKSEDYKFTLDNTNVIEGYNDHIKSMYWQGRYFLFYTGDDYAANTAFMIDMQSQMMPITTLGIKVLDAHVDEYEQPFVLLANSDTDDSTAFNKFVGAESLLTTTTQTGKNSRAIHKFGASATSRVPLHIRTGQNALGNPTERKRLKQIEFHGKGTVYCRVYVDGQWVIDATATMVEGPAKDRRIGIPIGTRGYYVDVEFCGDADIRGLEFAYDSMSSPS